MSHVYVTNYKFFIANNLASSLMTKQRWLSSMAKDFSMTGCWNLVCPNTWKSYPSWLSVDQQKMTCSPTSAHKGLPVMLSPIRLRPISAKDLQPTSVSVRRLRFSAQSFPIKSLWRMYQSSVTPAWVNNIFLSEVLPSYAICRAWYSVSSDFFHQNVPYFSGCCYHIYQICYSYS